MNSNDKELFRIAVLRVLNANHTQYGLGVEAVRHLVAVFGFQQVEHSEAEDAIYYLARRHFIEEIQRPLSPENRIWRISTLGAAFLDERT